MDGGKAISLTVDSGVPLWDFEFEKEPPKLTMENPFPKNNYYSNYSRNRC